MSQVSGEIADIAYIFSPEAEVCFPRLVRGHRAVCSVGEGCVVNPGKVSDIDETLQLTTWSSLDRQWRARDLLKRAVRPFGERRDVRRIDRGVETGPQQSVSLDRRERRYAEAFGRRDLRLGRDLRAPSVGREVQPVVGADDPFTVHPPHAQRHASVW